MRQVTSVRRLSGSNEGSSAGHTATWAARWRYAEVSRRDLRLDLLRGACVVAMLVDHLGGASWFFYVTGGNRFFVSAAEGFVFLSGLVMGLVYARLIARDGLWPATVRALRRAGWLYVWAVLLGAGFQLVSHWAGASWAESLDDFGAYALDIATLRQSTYLADVLMLYALLVLAAPLALALLARGQTAALLASSAILWGLHQVGLTAPLDRVLGGLAWFPPLAWQLVFVGGLVLGYQWRVVRDWATGRRWWPVLGGLALAAAGLIWLSIWAPGSPLAEPVARVFDHGGLRIGRLMAAAIFFPLLFGLATYLWGPLRAGLGWLLLPLGQHALLAYTLHLGLALHANRWWAGIPGYRLDDPLPNSTAHALSVLVLWALVRALPPLRDVGTTLAADLVARLPAWRAVPLAGVGLTALLTGLIVVAVPPRSAPAPGWSSVLEHGGSASVAPMATARSDSASAAATPIGSQALPGAATPVAARGMLPAAIDGHGMAPRQALPPSLGVTREGTFHSSALGREMAYLIHLPDGYDRDDERYPVLYLLHGLGGDRHEWAAYGMFARAGALMADGSLPPLLIVLPEGEQSYWVNHVDGPRWGDYVATDLVEHIDAAYRTRPESGQRAIGGLSMGAHGALTLALSYPDRFGIVGAHSPTLRSAEQALPFFGVGEDFRWRDPIALVEAGRTPPGLHLWLDAGDEDWWLPSVLELRATLERHEIPHSWRLFRGIHDGPYWAEHVDEYLSFYGAALARTTGTAGDVRLPPPDLVRDDTHGQAAGPRHGQTG